MQHSSVFGENYPNVDELSPQNVALEKQSYETPLISYSHPSKHN
jgi:hypothetical protein